MWLWRTSVESSGVGSGATLDETDCVVDRPQNVTIKGVTIYNTCMRAGSNLTFSNCYIHNKQNRGVTTPSIMATVLERNSSLKCTDCVIEGVGVTCIHSDNHYSDLKNCTFKGGHILAGGAPTKFENCTFQNTGRISQLAHYLYFLNNKDINKTISYAATNICGINVIFGGYNKLTSYIVYDSARPTPTIVLVNGSTLSLQGNNNSQIFQGSRLVVGTITADERPLLDQVTGSAIIITTTGGTITVSGEGTYLNNDGTTDLTIVT